MQIGWWGAFGGPVQKGIKSYGRLSPTYVAAVSPFQQNPFAGVFQGYMFNGFRRAVKHLPYSGIPFALGYVIYTWGNKESAYVNSKAGHLAHGGEH
ncbi:hypothetical protein FACS1894129_1330 [Actinomycetota bacterium]|nr:hypothetical protein FACS1894129_1330 [Actinomycetota bacterium]